MDRAELVKHDPTSTVEETRRRLLDAAARTFSKDGIRGATTREIAREAKVNEVTLFRHFKSKAQLLAAVIENGLMSELALMSAESSWANDLRENLARYAKHYYAHLEEKEAFARAFIAESRVLPEAMQTMIADVVKPVRDRLIAVVKEAQKAGVVRVDLDVESGIDAFKNTLYAGMLRQSGCIRRSYSTETYIDTVVEIFYRGIRA